MTLSEEYAYTFAYLLLRRWDSSCLWMLWTFEVFCDVSLEWDRYFGCWWRNARFWKSLLIPNIRRHGWLPRTLFLVLINRNCLERSRHWGRKTRRQILFFVSDKADGYFVNSPRPEWGLRFYWRKYSETGFGRLNNLVCAQNFDDIVCGGYFVDSVLNCFEGKYCWMNE